MGRLDVQSWATVAPLNQLLVSFRVATIRISKEPSREYLVIYIGVVRLKSKVEMKIIVSTLNMNFRSQFFELKINECFTADIA